MMFSAEENLWYGMGIRVSSRTIRHTKTHNALRVGRDKKRLK
jgi:hypothetical protein